MVILGCTWVFFLYKVVGTCELFVCVGRLVDHFMPHDLVFFDNVKIDA